MNPELRYFRDGAVVRFADIVVSGTAIQAAPADPMRYVLVVPNDAAVDLLVSFGEPGHYANLQLRVPPGNGPIVLSEDTIGELVRYPIWVQDNASGSTTLTFTTVSYEASRYDQMRRYTHAKLSRLISL